jgi:hypothetical protein
VHVRFGVTQPPALLREHAVRGVRRRAPGCVGHRCDDLPHCGGERRAEAQSLRGGPRLRGQQRERLVVGEPGQVRCESGQEREPAVAPALGVDRDPGARERLDVAQHGPRRDLQLTGEFRGRHPAAVA